MSGSHKGVLTFILSVCVFVHVQHNPAFAANDVCSLPITLRQELLKKHPSTHLVSIGDLGEYDKKLFVKDHGERCPGLVSVDFYGDGKPTWAVVLIAGEGPKSTATLIVARQLGEEWEIRSLDTAQASIPVVWREDPGVYQDVHGGVKLRATHSVIVLCGYESWAILYSWTGKKVEKIWIAD